MKKNKSIFVVTFIILILALVYTLSFSSNISYGNSDFTDVLDISNFNSKVQKVNSTLFYAVIAMLLVLLSCILTNSHNRLKYELSNIISTSTMSGAMILFSIYNLVTLPSFIKEYSQILIDHPDEISELKRVSSLIPSNIVYYFGIALAIVMILFSLFIIGFLVVRMKKQAVYLKMRNEALSNEI